MTNEVNSDTYSNGSAGGVVAWLALVLAIVALVLAWVAYNRTGQDLETRIKNQVNESVNSSQQGVQELQEDVQQGTDEARDEAEQQTDNIQEETQRQLEDQ